MRNKYKFSKLNFLTFSRNDYDGDKDALSASQADQSIREIIIKRHHGEEIEERTDVSERIMPVLGTAMHKYREETKYDGLTQEFRYDTELNGMKLSGKPDSIDQTYNFPSLSCDKCQKLTLEDLKVTGWLSIKRLSDTGKFSNMAKWESQLNTNRYILYRNNIVVRDIGVITVVCRDYGKSAKKSIGKCALWEVKVDMENPLVFEQVLYEKIEELKPWWDCKEISELPPCPEDYKMQFGGGKCSTYCQARHVCDQTLYRKEE